MKIRSVIAASAVLATAFVGLNAAPAMATDGGTTATATVSSVSIGAPSTSVNLQSATLAAANLQVDSKGRPYVAYQNLPKKHANAKKALHTPFASNYKAGEATGKAFRLKHGKKYPTSWNNPQKAPVYTSSHVRYPWQLFRPESDGFYHNRGFYNKKTKKWEGDCDNRKPPTGAHLVPESSVHIVKAFTSLRYTLVGGLHLDSAVSGMVSVDCGSGNASSASYQAKASADSKGVVTVTVSARSKSEAITKGAGKITSNTTLQSQANASLYSAAVIALKGTATATCTRGDTSTPPTCESIYGPGYAGNYPNCAKDGTTTPNPPPSVPGPNPPPADPGNSNKCYSETTGLPVTPNGDGTCPPGSYGA